MTGRADYYNPGDWNTVCYQCGFKRKASTMARNWQGYYVCPEHNEPRQPQDFVRGVPDDELPAWTQPMPTVVYTFIKQFLGIGDGVSTNYQLGDGLYPTSVSAVYLDDELTTDFTASANGLITLNSPANFPVQITASGVEVTDFAIS